LRRSLRLSTSKIVSGVSHIQTGFDCVVQCKSEWFEQNPFDVNDLTLGKGYMKLNVTYNKSTVVFCRESKESKDA
jgi:hypothetical protein